MKALSVHPYYAIGLVTGDKTIEVRTWNTDYRGDILIVSTAKKIKGLIPGHALGIVHLDNVRPMTTSKKDLRAAVLQKDDVPLPSFAWELSNARIIKPIPLKGKLSLWDCDVKYELLDLPSQTDEPEAWDSALAEIWRPYLI